MSLIAAVVAIVGGLGTLLGGFVAWRTAGSTDKKTVAEIQGSQLDRMFAWQKDAEVWRSGAEKDIGDLKADRDQLQDVNRQLRLDLEVEKDRIGKLERDNTGLHDYIDDMQAGVTEGRYPPFLPTPPRR